MWNDLQVALVHTPFNWKRPLTLISWAIRKVTKTHWNHCAVLIKIDGVWFVVESDIKGVTMIPYKNWVREQELMVFNIMDGSSKRIKLLEKVGVSGYSFADLFWFMPIYLLTGQFYGRKVDGFSNKPTCYEFAAWWLNNGSEFKNWYRMTPNEFLKQISESRQTKDDYVITKAKGYK